MRLPTADAREWLSSTIRHRNPWVYRGGREAIEIAPIVSPLRFDVLLRKEFFAFYSGHRELYRSNFDAFAERARAEEYFVWFERVMCRAWQPHVLEDPDLLAAAWAERLRGVAALHESFSATGFDSRFPITLYEGRKVLPTPYGKRVSRTIYAGDGNHRLALLMAAGQTALRPGQYRIKRFRRLVPSDTTPRLVAALGVDPHRYVAFLRQGYPALSIEATAGSVKVTGGPAADEVRELVRVDLNREAD